MRLAALMLAPAALIIGAPAFPAMPPPAAGRPTVEPTVQPSGPAFPSWLAGTWAMENGAAWGDEVWTSAHGAIMLGMGRMGFGPDVESWEAMRIVRRKDGTLMLVAQPKGGSAIEFPMVVAGPDSIEFGNAAHDFPQRIHYWREGQLLMAEVSKIDGSEAVRMNFRPVETAPKD